MWSWSTNVTDGQTDGRHALAIPRFYCGGVIFHFQSVCFVQISCDQFCWRYGIPSDFSPIEQYRRLAAVLLLSVLYVNVISCVGTMLSDVNCVSKWVRLSGKTAGIRTIHRIASTRVQCQKACEFDPQCVAVDWFWNVSTCYLTTHPTHIHHQSFSDHYELVSRCNVTPGQYYDSNAFVSIYDRTATQYDRLLASSCRLSVCDAVHCGSQGRCTRLKIASACSSQECSCLSVQTLLL